MINYTKEELDEVLAKHRAWLNDEKDGQRAHLQRADLRGSCGNRSTIKSMQIEKYDIAYTHDRLQIGCQNHAITDWWGFDDRKILEIDGRSALEFWKKWKPVLQQIIEMSPAEPTGYAAEEEYTA